MTVSTTLQAVRGLELPGPDLDLVVDGDDLVVTDHAVRRYRERVERVPRWLATRRIRALASSAAWRARPAPWMQIVIRPGVIYGYSPVRPDVGLLVRDSAVLTVLSRRSMTEGRSTADPLVVVPAQRSARSHRLRPR